ncbi:MAG: HEAT repeat domain-containing protein [Candidatus Promineifilaceae bacterium]
MDEASPFTEVMETLKNDEKVSVPLLYRFSDMQPEEWEHLQTVWPTLDDERRRVIVRHLADITEDSYHVDFTHFFTMALNDPSPAVRLASLDGLWDSEKLSLINPIIVMMQSDPDQEVRARAAGSLGQYIVLGEWEIIPPAKTEPIVEALLDQMDNPDTSMVVRRAALESLGAAYHPRVPELITAAYESRRFEMQVSAICAMGNSADKQWTAAIIEEFEHPDAEMRFMAARAAGQIGSSDMVDGLIELLEDEDLEVQLTAIASLGEIGGDVAREALEVLESDPELEDEIHEAVDEALEALFMMSGMSDFSLLKWDGDDDLEDEENGNWLPFDGEA